MHNRTDKKLTQRNEEEVYAAIEIFTNLQYFTVLLRIVSLSVLAYIYSTFIRLPGTFKLTYSVKDKDEYNAMLSTF